MAIVRVVAVAVVIVVAAAGAVVRGIAKQSMSPSDRLHTTIER